MRTPPRVNQESHTQRSSIKIENIVIQPLVDTHLLSHPTRIALLEGPLAQIVFYAPNPELVFHTIFVPKRLLMASSTTVHASFRQNPESLELSLHRTHASPRAVGWICAWLMKTCMQDYVTAFRCGHDWASNVAIYQAMTTLGMAGPIATVHRWLLERIAASILDCDELTLVLLAVHPTDTVYKHLANTHAYQRYNGYFPDRAQFAKYLKAFPDFALALAEVDKTKANGRRMRMLRNQNSAQLTADTKPPTREGESEHMEQDEAKEVDIAKPFHTVKVDSLRIVSK